LLSTSHAEEAVTVPSASHAEGAATLHSTSHAEGAATLPSTSHAEGTAILPATSHTEGAATLPSARVIPISQNKTFEELLLDQVNQMPHVKTGRKRICGGVEVITSGEVSERMKETE